ncbi:MAG: TonB-dependent receptor [Ignavibacteriaceae bacterium]|nr:TonB-dependent receptor [Ignavibacteriaceae bacterium]
MLKSFLVFLLFVEVSFAQTGTLQGKVTDESEPIPSVNILFMGSGFGTVTDFDGKYLLKNIPAGSYEVRFSSVGYETKFFDIKILPNKIVELNVVLPIKIIEVKEVQVTGLLQQDQKDTRTSLIDLSPRSAKILPGATEDVLRTLQSLPGVLAPNDFSSQLIVRGSGPDQNLIIMDDIEIFNPYRLYGVISMFNPDAVSNVNLITGGFPAMYGDRLSAVLDVTNREGTRSKNISGNVNVSIVDANLVLEGKNPFNLTGSWMFNTRRTYYDLIVEPFVKNAGLVEENVNFPNFHDFQGKIAIGPYKGHKFLLNGIYSRDGVDVVSAKNRKTADSISVNNLTKNDILGFAWHYAPSTKLLNKLVLSWYNNMGNTDFNSEILDPSLNRDEFKDVIPDTLAPYLLRFKFKADFEFRKYSIDDKFTYLWDENIFEAGAGVDFMRTIINFNFELDPELAAILASNPQFNSALSDLKDVKDYNRYRFYAQNNFKINNRLYFHPGLRVDHYDILNKTYFAPRVSLSYAIDDLTTLRGVYGVYYQSPGYEKMRDQNVLFDLSPRNTQNLEAEKATHYVVGIERWLNEEWNVKIETYYKKFNDLIVQDLVSGSKYFTEVIPGKDPRYSSGWTRPVINQGDSLTQIPINNSEGAAYGFELFLAKKNLSADSRISGWISYAFAFANRDDDRELPFKFDQRHTVNIVLNYKINNWLDVGARWQYGSGFPISEPVGIKPRIILKDLDLDGTPETPVIATRKTSTAPNAPDEVLYDIDFGTNKLNVRKPAYHRLDIRFTALTNFWNLDWTFYLDIINVYNRANVVGYDYFVTPDLTLGKKATNMFPIIPTFGFSVNF